MFRLCQVRAGDPLFGGRAFGAAKLFACLSCYFLAGGHADLNPPGGALVIWASTVAAQGAVDAFY